MKTVVFYKSKTGFAKKYAEIIGEKVNCDVIEYKNMTAEKMSQYDVVVYGAGLYAGTLNGLKKAKEMFAKSSAKKFVIFATGGTPCEATDKIDEVWKVNLSPEESESIPHFYMQGGICYEKMGWFDRMLMKVMTKALSKKQDKDSSEIAFEESLKSSYDISSEEYTNSLVQFLAEN